MADRPASDAAYTNREYALMEALREALSMLTPKQAFAEPLKYDSLYAKTTPLDLRPWTGVYPGYCVNPEHCRGLTHCPRELSCVE